jgi:hypothetical protein
MISHKRNGRWTLKKTKGCQQILASRPGAAPELAEARLLPSQDEIIAGIESLYADEVKPFGRILRKRIGERAIAAQAASHSIVEDPAGASMLPGAALEQLCTLCDECSLVRVVPEDGGAWSVLLLDREATFVDVYSPDDPYPEEFWTAVASHFEDSSIQLPGGRYACAEALIKLNLHCLAGLSLGQVCHVVQLSIAKRKIFGYLHGDVVPYARSQSMIKDNCAVWLQPCGALAASAMPVASWKLARKCLWEILESSAGAPQALGKVPMSNVKRLFRSRFQVELSETALGYTRLYELLQDKAFIDICSVQLQGNGYIVVQRRGVPVSSGRPSLGEAGRQHDAPEAGWQQRQHLLGKTSQQPGHQIAHHRSCEEVASTTDDTRADEEEFLCSSDEFDVASSDAGGLGQADEASWVSARSVSAGSKARVSIFATQPHPGNASLPSGQQQRQLQQQAFSLRSRLQANGMQYLLSQPRANPSTQPAPCCSAAFHKGSVVELLPEGTAVILSNSPANAASTTLISPATCCRGRRKSFGQPQGIRRALRQCCRYQREVRERSLPRMGNASSPPKVLRAP